MKTTAALPRSRHFAEEDASRIAVVSAIAAASMLFASLGSAYVVRRSFGDWQATAPSWPWALLLLCAGASGAVEVAHRFAGALRRRALVALVAFNVLYLAAALGVVRSVAQSESGLARPHDAFIALLLGVHVLHALLGGAFSVRLLWVPEEPSEHSLFLVLLVTHFLSLLLAAILALLFLPR